MKAANQVYGIVISRYNESRWWRWHKACQWL